MMVRRGIHPRRRSRGYVLVLALGMLVLAASLLVTVAARATSQASAAARLRDEMQRRWGMLSCRAALLPRAENLLQVQESLRSTSMPALSASIRLGDYSYELILADEQAKANINAILEGSDLPRAETQIRQALAGAGLAGQVRLRPTIGRLVEPLAAGPSTQPASISRALAVDGLGQVFENVPPVRLIRALPGARLPAAQLVTCWGSGAINVRRASEPALAMMAGRSLSGADLVRLVEARTAYFRQRGGSDAAVGRASEQYRKSIKETLEQSHRRGGGKLALVETSTCHSLWIVTRNDRREWYDLAILDRSNDADPQVYTFCW